MFELIDKQPDCGVQESEYKRLLGFPAHHALEGRSRELADQARTWYAKNGRPWIYGRELDGVKLPVDGLQLDGTAFSSRQLHDNFKEARVERVLLTAVSAGPECEEEAAELWRAGKPDEYFFLEMYGSAVVEHLITLASGRICAWADGQGMVALPHYSPGYSGWDVAEQGALWKLIRQARNGDFPGELDVLDTGMLRPKKSLLAIFGLSRELDKVRSRTRLVPCENCSLPGCRYRRAPYQYSPPQVEDTRVLQSPAPGLARDARYRIHFKALKKWAEQRLEIKSSPDGSVEAIFHFEGTTCSNLGHPILIDYEVMLGPAHHGYKILEMSCHPAAADTGNTLQCSYIQDAVGLMSSIDSEKPLLGQPLNDILSWDRPFAPSGCLCYADRRAHKWGLVLEVIHYALVQRELELETNGQAGKTPA